MHKVSGAWLIHEYRVTVELMPTGFEKSARRMRASNFVRPGAIAALAVCLPLVTIPAAQSSTSAEEVTDAVTSSSLYPAPGQPSSEPEHGDSTSVVQKDEDDLRVATLHTGITADSSADQPVENLISALRTGNHTGSRAVAQTVQTNAPDVLVLTGVSYDTEQQIAELLKDHYFAAGQRSETGLDYPYVFTAPTNSGRESGVDLDGDGTIGGAGDAIGYGEYPGQYGTVVFSKYPIVEDQVRTFQNFLWSDLPENSMPEDRYSELEESVLRLNETSLWDVPVDVDGETVHIISSSVVADHDDAEPARGEDIRRVVADYAAGQAWYLYDDDGETSSLSPGTPFVMAGIPAARGASAEDVSDLLDSPVIQDPEPEAVTEVPLSERADSPPDPDATATHHIPDEQLHRSSFVLPSAALEVTGSGVFWPGQGERGYEVVNPDSAYSLDDRLVWVDLTIDR